MDEFDGPWNCYNQDFYKSAFRYVKERIDALGAARVATVWQAATYPDDGDPIYDYEVSPAPRAHYDDWYPGDDVVDWVGISFFSGSHYLDYQWSCPDPSEPWMRDNADVVRGFSYIDTNWQAQSRWACSPAATACTEGYWGDTRLEANHSVLDRFFAELTEPPFALP